MPTFVSGPFRYAQDSGVNVLTYFPDLPQQPNEIWTANSSNLIDKADAYIMVSSGTVFDTSAIKNTLNFAQCGSYN